MKFRIELLPDEMCPEEPPHPQLLVQTDNNLSRNFSVLRLHVGVLDYIAFSLNRFKKIVPLFVRIT